MTIRGQSADGVPSMGATPPAPEDLDATEVDASTNGSGLRHLDPVPDEPPANLRYRRAFKLGSGSKELWRSRSIVFSLTVRDLRATYSQEILGFAWAVLTPLVQMVVFTFLFNRLNTRIDTGGVWYPIFLYVGLMPWTFFSGSVSGGGTSLVNNPLLNKVYAPREVFPIAEILGTVVSTLLASVALVVLFVIDGRMPSVTSYWAIPLLLILAVFTTGVTLLVAGMTVYLRDMRHALPLVLQVGLFATPILWPLTEISASLRGWYVALNPVGGVIDGLRRCVLYDQAPRASYTIIAAVMSIVWLLGSFMLFKRLETGFADVS